MGMGFLLLLSFFFGLKIRCFNKADFIQYRERNKKLRKDNEVEKKRRIRERKEKREKEKQTDVVREPDSLSEREREFRC